MTLTGDLFIGRARRASRETFRAVDPRTAQAIDPDFSAAGDVHVTAACDLAEQAFDIFRETTPEARAAFLESIAEYLTAAGPEITARAGLESGLPAGRLQGELGRTTGQLRLFAQVLRQGDWLDVRIDPAKPDRQPLPRSDIRQRRIAVGPVAVFGASNFPLAFSTAGGDTASALAAGCPVVVKGHPSHPGTSELVAGAIRAAIEACGMPEGVFSLLQGPSNALGAALVRDPRIAAVGFTGSRGGGLALVALAQARPQPIPVYAEMSSINPVILFPNALAARAETLGAAFIGSLTLGAGQFCTNPGLVLAIDGPDLERFIASAAAALDATPSSVMLSPGIHRAYETGVAALEANPKILQHARGCLGEGETQGRGALFSVAAEDFLADPSLSHEVFGSSSVVVRCPDLATIAAVLRGLEGQLTASLQMDAEDHASAKTMLPILERKAGRILANGWPTGVEVCWSMVHGGPFPATSDPRTTSVGAAAIERFLRSICYQDLPQALLPAALHDDNPFRLRRRLDGEMVA
jgi:NADP-dependent aldehyde dehydrogenase